MEESELNELLKEAEIVMPFLANRLDEQKNWKRSEAFLEKLYQVSNRQIEFLKSGRKEVSERTQEIAAIEAKKAELTQELRSIKPKLAEAQEAHRAARDERNREIAELDNQIEVRQQKLTAIESRIKEKSAVLANLIADELAQ